MVRQTEYAGLRLGMIIILSLAFFFSDAQVRPDQFPEETNPTNDNFEVYSQKAGINRRASLDNLKKAVTPDIKLTPIVYVPTETGNSSNRTDVVIDPYGDIWYIDGGGEALKLGSTGLAIDTSYTSGDTTFIINGMDTLIITGTGGGAGNKTGDIVYVSEYGNNSLAMLGFEGLSYEDPAEDLGVFPSCDLVYGYAGEWTWALEAGDISYDVTDFQDHLINKPGLNTFYFEPGTVHTLNNWGSSTQAENYLSDGGITPRAWAYPLDLSYQNDGTVVNNISNGSQRVAFNFADSATVARVLLNRFTGTTGSAELLNVQGDVAYTNVRVNQINTVGGDGLVRMKPERGRHLFNFNSINWKNTTTSGAFDVLFRSLYPSSANPDNVNITINGRDVTVDGTRGGLLLIGTAIGMTVNDFKYSFKLDNFTHRITTVPNQILEQSCSEESVIRIGTSTDDITETYIDSEIYIEINNVYAQEYVINLCEIDLTRSKLHIKINSSMNTANPAIRLNDPRLIDHSTIIIEGDFETVDDPVIAWRDGSNEAPSRAIIDSTSMIIFKGRYKRQTGGSPVSFQDSFTNLHDIAGGRIMFEDAVLIAGNGISPAFLIPTTCSETVFVKNVASNTLTGSGINVIGEPIMIYPELGQ